jgi:hypothetical protein
MTKFLKNAENWNSGMTYDKYLGSAEAQDAAFKTNSDKSYARLLARGVIKESMSQDEIAGILEHFTIFCIRIIGTKQIYQKVTCIIVWLCFNVKCSKGASHQRGRWGHAGGKGRRRPSRCERHDCAQEF